MPYSFLSLANFAKIWMCAFLFVSEQTLCKISLEMPKNGRFNVYVFQWLVSGLMTSGRRGSRLYNSLSQTLLTSRFYSSKSQWLKTVSKLSLFRTLYLRCYWWFDCLNILPYLVIHSGNGELPFFYRRQVIYFLRIEQISENLESIFYMN